MSERDLDAAVRAAQQEENVARFDDRELAATYREIEAAMGARDRRPVWRGLALGTGLAAAVAGLVALVLLFPPGEPPEPGSRVGAPLTARILRSAGQVELWGPGGPVDVALETAVSRVRLSGNARADLDIRAARLAIRGPASLVFDSRGPRVETGRVAFSVPRRPRGSPFVIGAGDAEVVVRGTELVVAVTRGHLDAVWVREGSVEVVTPASAPRSLGAGESYQASPGIEIDTSETSPFDAPWWRERGTSVGMGRIVVRSEPEGARVRIGGRRVGRTPLSVSWPTGTYGVAVTHPGHRRWRSRIDLDEQNVREINARLAVEKETPSGLWRAAQDDLDARRCRALKAKVETLSERASADDRARARMLQAECAMRTGARKRALSIYEEIAREHSTESAEVAQFEAAKLLVRLGRSREALAAMQRYLDRYPSGQFASFAAFRRCDLLIRLDQLDRARDCLDDYRRGFAGAVHANDATLLSATLARANEDWKGAAGLYRRYLAEAPSSARRESALYHLAVCLHRGKLDGLEQTIAEYLRAYPRGQHREALEELQP
ncbi:MAG: PEGA domain-containing protein [Deltaproteobacteria bacterium]|jgi:TolA-binding protein|nr:PEGA domain-containing protein [Deltaproteobacteria bacterium]